MKRLLVVSILCLLCSEIVSAQSVKVKRNVNLRAEASTSSAILEKLSPDTDLTLLVSNKTAGFYHVTAPDGQTGWVWSKNVSVLPSTPSQPSGPSSPTTPLFSSLENARKVPVPQPLVIDGSQVCGPTGDATNTTAIALNTDKNRTDIPGDSDYVDLTWSQLESLPTDQVDNFVSAPVRAVGFLSHQIKVENTGSGESTNCHKTADDMVDWHIYFTQSANQPISAAVIVETTPRTRPLHKWTTAMLSPLVNSTTQVRISGWLMYDSEHIGVIGTQRATVWEIHPITKIEVQQNGAWVDLDQ
jgi:uncharacterized protein YgiM (DUF1202 family)